MALDDFLICRNCINWGQPWLLRKKAIICEQRHDINGKVYTSQHPACRYFVPIQGKLPENLQMIRLFVQTLTHRQQSYFAWALSQVSLLLNCKDSMGQTLILGDQVSFRLGLFGHTGTVEGVNPQHKKAIIVNSPAFIHSNISLLAESVTKVTKEEAQAILKETPEIKDQAKWHIDCLIQEITNLRSKEKLSAQEYASLIIYEDQLKGLKLNNKYASLITSI